MLPTVAILDAFCRGQLLHLMPKSTLSLGVVQSVLKLLAKVQISVHFCFNQLETQMFVYEDGYD